ncbi:MULTISPECIES: hypothetical protein [Microbacteriaceae]|uniref:hypothetical protein n=1 Tax=Microbacteriaceae TaxID=85023 RepID=UPI000490C5D2|nr:MULTISPECIES: hypothetical protein [Microbacteriaceae]MDR6611074.1 hypothetical protein [Leifsonia sp. 1010]SDH70083.1 hypothetical protein SAMN04515690_3733 [Leifsonia sp. 197AMF]SDI69793.1 hypothetical protein SAMN04515684_0056 [Leifsonia sp. 466MF]SDK21382.1 hypothetical protein SAMN04515683_2695 [Leifsonia sp. 157MF]SDN72150.1 hypothetical protein SAMN04515686_2257 [Leifsonia sp. 509MF]
MSEADITAPTTLGPGCVPGGMPLKIHLGEPEYAALVRIAQHRHTTAAKMVEELVLHALARADVPPPVQGPIKRPHTTYDDATQGFRRD